MDILRLPLIKNNEGTVRLPFALLGKIGFFYIIVYVIQGLMYGDNLWETSFNNVPSSPGVPGAITDIWGFFTFLWRLFVFDVAEIPVMLKIIILAPVTIVMIAVVIVIILNVVEIIFPDWL